MPLCFSDSASLFIYIYIYLSLSLSLCPVHSVRRCMCLPARPTKTAHLCEWLQAMAPDVFTLVFTSRLSRDAVLAYIFVGTGLLPHDRPPSCLLSTMEVEAAVLAVLAPLACFVCLPGFLPGWTAKRVWPRLLRSSSVWVSPCAPST